MVVNKLVIVGASESEKEGAVSFQQEEKGHGHRTEKEKRMEKLLLGAKK